MRWSRRKIIKTAAGASAAAVAASAFHRVAAATPFSVPSDFKAVIGVFLFGGHDGWNMAVPLDKRYDAYRAARGRALALPRDVLLPVADSAFGLHPSFKPLYDSAHGALNVVLNTGALKQPLTKALYLCRPDLRPVNAMLHAEAEMHWGRDADVITTLARLSAATGGTLFTADETQTAVNAGALRVDAYFQGLTSDVARQLHGAARALESRAALESRQAFMVSQFGYDTHTDQVAEDHPAKGRQAALYADLATGLAAFHAAMTALGLGKQVTAFTMSEFGRSYKGNWERGTEHAWGNNHLILGGAAQPEAVRGVYPTPILGGPDDVVGDGRWLPSMSIEAYLVPIARWYGVAETDMARVFPQLENFRVASV